MTITTISKKRYITYDSYIKQPRQWVETNWNMLISKNPHLVNALERSINHPLIRKYSNTPLKIQQIRVFKNIDNNDSFIKCTRSENDDNFIIIKYLLRPSREPYYYYLS